MMRACHGFPRWLRIATRGLPEEILEVIADELTAHYEESLSDYLQAGTSHEAAQQAALADLGDPKATGRALRTIHVSRRNYLRAAIARFVPSLLLMVSIPMLNRGQDWIEIIYVILLYVVPSVCLWYIMDRLISL